MLLAAYGKAFDWGLEIEVESKSLLEDVQFAFYLRNIQLEGGLDSEHDVLPDGKGGYQHEVLVNHTDSHPDGLHRIYNGGSDSLDVDLTRIGLIEAVKDLHDRGLTRPIFPDHTVNAGGRDPERDIVIGHKLAERLCNVLKFEREWRAQTSGPQKR